MIPARFAPILFGLILSGLMSAIISGIATWRALGLPPEFVLLWSKAWLSSWIVAFPAVLFVAPLARRLVASMTAPPKA